VASSVKPGDEKPAPPQTEPGSMGGPGKGRPTSAPSKMVGKRGEGAGTRWGFGEEGGGRKI